MTVANGNASNRSGRRIDATSVGVVIPAHDRESTIERAIRSALDQSRPPERIVVVDDGSTDATAHRVRELGADLTLVQQANAGVSAARNRGVAELDTDWVAFLDSDDYWTRDHLQRIVTAIEATGGVADVYFADARSTELADDTTLWQMSGFSTRDRDHLVARDATEWVMMPLHPMAIQACVVRRARYVDLDGMWSALRSREDTHLLFRLGLSGPFCAVDGVGAVITGDASSGQRLTTSHGSLTEEYAGFTIAMYQDLIASHPDLAEQDTAILRDRLLSGYLAQASMRLRRRQLAGLSPLVQALRSAPGTTLRRVAGSLFGHDLENRAVGGQDPVTRRRTAGRRNITKG